MVKRIASGENNLVIDLWEQVRKLVIKIMLKRLPRGGNCIELDDLTQAGFLGMMRAIKDFDSSSGFTFTTYLNFHLKTAAQEALGTRSEKQKRDPILNSISTNTPIFTEGELTIEDTIEDESTRYIYDDLVEDLANKKDVEIILGQIETLSQEEQVIFKQRYIKGLTLEAIGRLHGYKVERIRSVISKALRKLGRTQAVRLIAKRNIDSKTNFYQTKGLNSFKNTFSSSVEDIVNQREWLRSQSSL